MAWDSKQHRVALAIMVAVTALNVALAINFVGASGRALAAAFTSQTIFLLAGVELIAVLTSYVVSKHGRVAALPRSRAHVARV